MRGKLYIPQYRHGAGGITPAHAGKTGTVGVSAVGIEGSPPRMRGKLFVTPFLLAVSRITPAHAGKTALVTILIW